MRGPAFEAPTRIEGPFGRGPRTDGSLIRTAAAQAGIACITTLQGLLAALRGIEALLGTPGEPRSIQEWHRDAREASAVQERLAFGERTADVAAS